MEDRKTTSMPNASSQYRTCRNCAFAKTYCARRDEIRSIISGSGITSCKFKCDARRPIFHVGQRVGVTWLVIVPDWGWEEGLSREEWPATVVAETSRGFRIVVDDVPSDHDTPARDYIKNDSLYCNVSAGRLRALKEADRRVCIHCKSAENSDGTVTGCWGKNEEGFCFVGPERCLAQAIDGAVA